MHWEKGGTHFILSPITIKFEKNFLLKVLCYSITMARSEKMTTEAGLDVDREEHLSLTICGNTN